MIPSQKQIKTKNDIHISKHISSKIQPFQKPSISNKCSFFILINSVLLIIPLFLFTIFIFINNKTKTYKNQYTIMWSEHKKLFMEYAMIHNSFIKSQNQTQLYMQSIETVNEEINKTQNKIKENELLINQIKSKIDGNSPGKYEEYISLENEYIKLENSYEGIKKRLYNELRIENSRIVNTLNEIEFLFRNSGNDIANNIMKLCYSSEIDEMKSDLFHKRCDGIGKTVTLYKSGKGRFGGYCEGIWEKKEESVFKKDEKAFLFNLDKMKVYIPKNMNEDNSIVTGKGYFPSFGNLDLAVTDSSAISKFPNSYNVYMDGDVSKIPEEGELTNYEKEFHVEIIEVYIIQEIDL